MPNNFSSHPRPLGPAESCGALLRCVLSFGPRISPPRVESRVRVGPGPPAAPSLRWICAARRTQRTRTRLPGRDLRSRNGGDGSGRTLTSELERSKQAAAQAREERGAPTLRPLPQPPPTTSGANSTRAPPVQPAAPARGSQPRLAALASPTPPSHRDTAML